jgi:hypothetical protein
MLTPTARMLFPTLIIGLILILVRSGSSQAQARKAPVPSSQTSSMVFEIMEKDARPKAPGDEYLYFRLYEDGTAEFEFTPLGSMPQGFRMHKIHLNEEERDELFGLARGCLASPADFDPMQRLEEKVMISKIRIRDEDGDYNQIVIHHYSPENEKTRLYFPKVARDLMQKVSHLRGKYLQET